jgi:hypothetical protein
MNVILEPIIQEFAATIDCILKHPENHALCYVNHKEQNIILDGFIRNI